MPRYRMQPEAERVAARRAMPSPAAVVVAHPDDEALWLSSILGYGGRVVFCFGDLFGRPEKSAARRKALAALPLPGVIELGMAESGAGSAVDWAHPRPTPTGIAIVDPAASARYEANYRRLVASLRSALAGLRTVWTHNPWGEYGHPEHVQVHRAVAALQAELGYTLWFSNYVGKASWTLARQLAGEPSWTERMILPPDLATVRRLKKVYRDCGAWTWTRGHRWPVRETLYGVAPPGDRRPQRALSGETLLDVAGLRWWSLPWRSARKRLR